MKERGENIVIKKENEMKLREVEREEEEKRVRHRQKEMEKTEREKVEKKGDKRTEAAVRGVEDSWTLCHRDVWTSRQRNTRIVRQ